MRHSIKKQIESQALAIQTRTHSDTPRLDAEILLTFVLKRERSYLMAWPEKTLTASELQQFQQLVDARCIGKPIAQLTGVQEFWSLPLSVNEHTLIPRPDTECLVEYILQTTPNCSDFQVIDAGTGTGAIALALAKERANWSVFASDFSVEALNIAFSNKKALGLPVTFVRSDWLSAVADQCMDIVVSNPPYIASDDPHLNQLEFEPRQALVAEEDGLACIKILASEAQRVLKPAGRLMVEHGFEQAEAVQKIFDSLGFKQIETIKDYAGHDRHTIGCKLT